MKVLIIGAAGMIGRKLTVRLVPQRKTRWQGNHQRASRRCGRAAATGGNAPFTVTLDAFDIAASYVASKLVAPRPDVIFLLASVVSGEAEADFDKGYAMNLGGTHAIFEAIPARAGFIRRRLQAASDLHLLDRRLWRAISGQDRRRASRRSIHQHGTQKAICELWLADYSRRGFFDGIGLRLPTICVRPGLPNKAASGFFSGIIASPSPARRRSCRSARTFVTGTPRPEPRVEFLLRAAELDLSLLGARRSLNLPGVSVTVGEQIEALRAIAGDKTVTLIRREPDETIIRIVAGWARDFDPARAKSLGFQPDASFSAIINAHIEDELNG